MSQTTSVTGRQRAILDFIREHGAAQVDPLAEAFGVTPQTIRRDLNRLYDLDLLQRVHGGAVVKDGVENLGYRARRLLMADEKEAIGAAAATLIPDNSSLFMNIGTTTESVSRYLRNHVGLLVITNNINVASTLWPCRDLEVLIAGGSIRHTDGGIVGPSTEDFVGRFKVDYAVIGCSAIEESGEVFDYDLREVRVAQAIIRRARSVIMVADSMTFSRRAPVQLTDFAELDHLVTDDGAPDHVRGLCETHGVQLHVAAGAAGGTSTEISHGH